MHDFDLVLISHSYLAVLMCQFSNYNQAAVFCVLASKHFPDLTILIYKRNRIGRYINLKRRVKI